MNQFFTLGGQSIGASSSASVLSGLTSFRIDGFDLVTVQRTLRSLFRHHALKVLILQCSASFLVQLWHLYITTGKIIALTRRTLDVGRAVSLLSNTLSRFVMAFLPRSQHLLGLWLHSPSAVILEAEKIKICLFFHLSLSICREVMGLDAMIWVFECWDSSQLFHSALSPSSRGSLDPLQFLPLGG